MSYDFDTIYKRTNSAKWMIGENELPLSVADMEFQNAPEIMAAIKKRTDEGLFGYQYVPDEWYDAYISWWRRRHDFEMERENLIFCIGVIPSLSAVIRALTLPGEKILVQSPVYHIFYHCIEDDGRYTEYNELKYKNDKYEIDFDDLEKKLSDPNLTMFILCNPHNPTGNLWEKGDLKKIGELCLRHNVILVSDEIHSDISDPGTKYTPFAAASEVCKNISVTLIAPTKIFSIPSTHTSAVYTNHPVFKNRIKNEIAKTHIGMVGTLSIDAAVSAFNDGEEWLNAACEYIYENKKYVDGFLKEKLPLVKRVKESGTYLIWLDVSAYKTPSRTLSEYVRKKTGLVVNDGEMFRGDGENFIRINVACPRTMLEDGMERLYTGLSEYVKKA